MLATRLIPCLLMDDGALVKTVQFKKKTYVGDPVNAVRIFNQKEVDELILIDISATTQGRGIDFPTIQNIVGECFMPICYGGGVTTVDEMRKLFALGIEKISISSAAIDNPALVRRAAAEFGNQAVVITLDVKKNFFGKYTVRTHGGSRDTKVDPVTMAREMEAAGAGEILLYSIDRDGTWSGFDLTLLQTVCDAVSIPVIACGGAGSLEDVRAANQDGHASAVAIGSMAVFQGKDLGVLIKFPSREQQESIFEQG
ncbi:AglZ/HisF2 family acetamidino modification protein [Andreprevotia chitinilytica]|uniref:AglZ/HisF2 family acetamidino modification protein n=1 Tax=Andreprevotia chitinilytica TaxID=396808 RepID=UPI00054E28D7|nr:AglZ/HisF2 family acetamidino modification protein [Andreprevotia chitinilytica]